MKRHYPFEPKLKHHFLISVILAIWVFVFLYFTEPLDVSQLSRIDKLTFLPGYAILAALLYVIHLPIQYYIYKKKAQRWSLGSEIIFFILFIAISIFALRYFYLAIIMDWHPYAYSFYYHLSHIIFPALLTIIPIIIIARFAFGKYHEKKLDDKKLK